MSIESVMPSNQLILCGPLLLLPSVFPNIRVFSNESALLIKWSKDWSLSFNISLSNEHPGLISFKMDWLDLFVVQEILKSHLQHYSSKASILQCSAFFIVQLSHPYMTTGKNDHLSMYLSSVCSLSEVCLLPIFMLDCRLTVTPLSHLILPYCCWGGGWVGVPSAPCSDNREEVGAVGCWVAQPPANQL